ncbi:SDR family NAD(P)-dependent oxidoreductase [Arthrobacter sp. KNU-44]|uniref:SDR family NAD(P)-dependent oxidoreductase n=1 Tax=Arthrobacter sp. KNU-44 TaxID=3450744 RepID=UPI003F42CB7A
MPRLESPFDLSGRTAVVTGAGGGIGAAIADVLARANAHVVVVDIQSGLAKDTAEEIKAAGYSAEALELDVRDRAAVDAAVDGIKSRRGRLDVFVNNAGIIGDASPFTVSEDELDSVMAVNFKGVVFGSQAAARAMMEQGFGSIVNVTTGGVDKPMSNVAAYTGSKAAAHQYTRSLALELAPGGVRVNSLAAGWVETPMTRRHLTAEGAAIDEQERDAFHATQASRIPLGFTGDAYDQAYAVLYLVSDAARFVTGSVIRPNGGSTMLW